MKNLISILLRGGLLLLGLSLGMYLPIWLLQSAHIILPQHLSWRFFVIVSVIGAISFTIGVALYNRTNRNYPGNKGMKRGPMSDKNESLSKRGESGACFLVSRV
jgi:hypothetical protein